jgi:Cu-Zn family superoxide dismutase
MPVVYVLRGGVAFASFVTDRFTPAEIVGRAVIVHARPDNYANVPVGEAPNQYTPNSPAATALTEATGNAGERVVAGSCAAERRREGSQRRDVDGVR